MTDNLPQPVKPEAPVNRLDLMFPNARLIPLTKGAVATVDAADYDEIAACMWHVKSWRGKQYAMRTVKRNGVKRTFYMHRVLMQPGPGLEIDHIDGDGLNNRRTNLRVVTRSQNQKNMRHHRDSLNPYKGIHRDKARQVWVGTIWVAPHNIYLGGFAEPKDAALAYDEAALRYYGPFALVNFPRTEVAANV